MSIEEARARLEALMLVDGTHQDYARCVQLATMCRRYATGDVAPLMRRYVRRESEADFEARVNMTIETVSSTFGELKTPYYNVSKLRGAGVTKALSYPDASPADALRFTERATQAIDRYYNQKPLEEYLSEFLARSVSFSDPNAWLLTTFGPFDYRTQLAHPYPVLLPCEAVVDFTRQAGAVTSMSARLQVSQDNVSGWRYTCYLENEAVDYWPVLYPVKGNPISTLPGGNAMFTVVDAVQKDRVLWEGRAYRHGAGRVPATPIGYVPDEVTESRTFQSPLMLAMPYLRQMLKVGSESDIVMAQMSSPIRAAYVTPCARCRGTGVDSETLDTCGVCGGTGEKPVSTTAQDTITMPLPKDAQDVVVKPGDLMAFIGPDVALPQMQLDYLQSRRELAAHAVGQVSQLTKVTVAPTATDRLSQLEKENTALSPFADQYSALWVYHTHVSAAYVDAGQGLEASYRFPPGLNLETEIDLYNKMKVATDSGAPGFMLEQIGNAMARRQFAYDPEQLRRYFTKTRFVPFLGFSTAQFLQLAALGYMTTEERVLRTHSDSIFSELETERPEFYDLAQSEQQRLVNEKAAAIVARLSAAAPASFPRLSLTPPAPAVPVTA